MEQTRERFGTQLVFLGLRGDTSAKWLLGQCLEWSEDSLHRNVYLRNFQNYYAGRRSLWRSAGCPGLQGRHGSLSGLSITLHSNSSRQVGTAR